MNVAHLSGLHDAGLAAFQQAQAIVNEGMRPKVGDAELLLREVRSLLATAHQLEVAGEIEDAEAIAAIAGNKLARALRATRP